jgi:hypothetical protein
MRGSAARGCVSVAVTKMARGSLPEWGMRLNGRVRNAVHRPVLSNAPRKTRRGGIGGAVELRLYRLVLERDDDRLQHPPGAAIDRGHDAAARRGEDDSRIALVVKERLPDTDPVANLNRHSWLEADVVGTDRRRARSR